MASRKALFLDRDGVINVDHGYVHKIKDFQFVEGIFELCQQARLKGYMVVVVTNQAGIGRGYYTERDFLDLTAWMKKQFANKGVYIDAVYFSPFHPEHGVGEYRQDTLCRKPNPGMLIRAAREHGIDLKQSVFIGDKDSDMEAGQRAGVGHLVLFSAAAGRQYTADTDGSVVKSRELKEILEIL